MIKVLSKFLKFCPEYNRRKLMLSALFTVISCMSEAAKIPAAYLLIRAIVRGTVGKAVVLECFALMAASLFIASLAKNRATLLQTEAGYGTCADKRIEIGEHMRYVPMGYFNKNSTGRILSVSTNTLGILENIATRTVMMVMTSIINTALITVMMFVFDFRIGIVLAAGLAVFYTVNRYLFDAGSKMAPEKDRNDTVLVEQLIEYIQGITEVKTYGLTGSRCERLNTANRNCRNSNIKMELKFVPLLALQTVVIKMTGVAVCFAALSFTAAGTMPLENCIVFILSSFVVYSYLESSSNYTALLRTVDISVDKVNSILNTPQMDIDGKDIETENSGIDVDGISFAYGDRKIIDGISAVIPEKTTTAIVGPSGGGKSTFVNLIARFWDVDDGGINLSGRDIREYSYDSLMKNFSFVFQNVFLFNDTVANNIRFGNTSAPMEEVIEAAKKARCHEFITSLPDGYDTVIGDEGINLSGGERQRISIARAIMKNAPVIILDEATANVDPENEEELMAAIDELTREKTIIMIAHRLKTVRRADNILVIDRGRIVQQGTHEELIVQDGIYRNFVSERKEAVSWKL